MNCLGRRLGFGGLRRILSFVCTAVFVRNEVSIRGLRAWRVFMGVSQSAEDTGRWMQQGRCTDFRPRCWNRKRELGGSVVDFVFR